MDRSSLVAKRIDIYLVPFWNQSAGIWSRNEDCLTQMLCRETGTGKQDKNYFLIYIVI